MKVINSRKKILCLILIYCVLLTTACTSGTADKEPIYPQSSQFSESTSQPETAPNTEPEQTSGGEDGITSPTELPEDNPSADVFYPDADNPDLSTIVVNIQEGFLETLEIIETEGSNGDQISVVPMNDNYSADDLLSVYYTEDTQFYILNVDKSTYNTELVKAGLSDIQKDQLVYMWGNYDQNGFHADAIAVFQLN